ncbi:MAG TPA: winged helix-turn-helix domain-containing protein [Kribbella sp.]|nr:winged helix-turn-helix domain-containing protein [Kribbella sp.]HET6296201.1 winged helix-turn-helix domain-containing protein [Kribbella sp.]
MIPDFQTLMRPTLAYLADGQTKRSRAVKEAMAAVFALTDGEQAELLPSGRQRTIDNRVAWALTYLSQAGLVERPQRGVVRISDVGRQALEANPEQISLKVLEQYPAYVAFRSRTRDVETPAQNALPAAESSATPQDLLEQAVKENGAVIENELLQRALALPSIGFEDLVMKLLAAVGYGHAGRVERTSASGDAGIDGIISQDPLGLDRIYVRRRGTRSTRSSTGQRFSPLLAPSWVPKAIGVYSSRPAPSAPGHGRKRAEWHSASSLSMAQGLPSSCCVT